MVQCKKRIWLQQQERHQRRCMCTPDCRKEEEPGKCLRGVGDGEAAELHVAEGEEGAEQQTLQALGVQRKAVHVHQPVTITAALRVAGVLQATSSRITGTARVGERRRDPRVPPKARPDSAGPTAGAGAHLTACREPMGVDHSGPPSCAGRGDGGC